MDVTTQTSAEKRKRCSEFDYDDDDVVGKIFKKCYALLDELEASEAAFSIEQMRFRFTQILDEGLIESNHESDSPTSDESPSNVEEGPSATEP